MKVINKLTKAIAILFLVVFSLFIYTWRIEPHWVEWTHIDMPIANLPDSLEGKTLIQISDIHIGERVNDDFIIDVFEKAKTVQPDYVVFTGDFISPLDSTTMPYEQLQHILKHKVEGKLGTIAIFGNHDYGVSARNSQVADSLAKILTANGITILRNDAIDKSGLHFIGIDDYWGQRFNLPEAMANYKPDQATIVLCHNPDVADFNSYWNNYQGWILSGHTHGGQIRIPFGKPLIIPVENKNYDAGLKQLSNNRHLYINRGLGHAIRLRFNVRPEVTIFTLRKAK